MSAWRVPRGRCETRCARTSSGSFTAISSSFSIRSHPAPPIHYVDDNGQPFSATVLENAYVVVWRWMDGAERRIYNERNSKRCERVVLVIDLLDGLEGTGGTIQRTS